ncbi:MAG: patatin-like phospholipase family protein [Candidatus Dormibacteria bacterium]
MTKAALVLSGGGLTGAVYHIGALRALNDALLDRSVNDFDIYVGTSAGAIITSCIANGIRTKDLFRAIAGEAGPANLSRGDVFSPNLGELARRLAGLPAMSAWACWHYLRHTRDMDLVDFMMLFADALPSGLFDGESIGRYLSRTFKFAGRSDDFRDLQRDLQIIATDLDNGERVVFGSGGNDRVPISRAAAASAAVPVLYTPVKLDGRELVDGGLRGTASIDVAIERGAELVICVNPLVPFDNRSRSIPRLGTDARTVSEKGFSAITNQVARTALHAGLQYHLKQVRRLHPEVDIILIEPRRTDARMFFDNPMRFSSRMQTARHGYQSVLVELDENYRRNRDILARHDMTIRRSLLQEQLRLVKRAAYDPRVVAEVLQARIARPLEVGARDQRWGRLEDALELLDRELAYQRSASTGRPRSIEAAS